MLTALLGVPLLLLSAAAAAADLPLSVVSETESYASADQAAIAALRRAMPLSENFENGGVVVERDGSFFYSEPVSNGQTGHIRFRAGVRKGDRLVALYHTHPSSEPDSRMFSWDDVAEAKKLDVNSYIGVLGDGTVRFFDPHRTPTRPYDQPGTNISPGRVSDGVIVATILNR
ncbi:MAG TPA: DUF4329 domain-containing protein [Elusimicrobiota bacterium]|nr:DUF4329 domain-containing protein [Elusimicrobiota bacterium]